MTGTGNSGINFETHDTDKKTFYGLLKKKQAGQTEKAPASQEEQIASAVTAVEPEPVYPAEEQPVNLPEEVIAEPQAALEEEPEELRRILSKPYAMQQESAIPAPEPAPAAPPARYVPEPPARLVPEAPPRRDDRLISSAEIDSLRHNKSEEDIINEFNTILSKSKGADIQEQEPKAAVAKKTKADKKLKKKFEFEAYDPEKQGPMSVFTGLADFEEIERYWVIEPYSFVVILYNEKANTYLYYVCEPTLTIFEKELLEDIYQRLQDVLLIENIDPKSDRREMLVRKTTEVIVDYIGKIDTKSYHKLIYYIVRDYIQVGKIEPLMNDNFIEDISCNGFDTPVFLYHKNYENIMTNITFNERQLDSFVIRLAQRCGKHISIAEPMVDATMPDGSRIQMTLGKEITTRGSTFTIRKFKEIPITPVDLIAWNTFSSETMAYLWLCIENNKSLIFSGGTASGKTSSLNAVALFIPPKAKVISLEDTRELKLPHQNWIPGLTRDSFTADGKGAIEMFALLKAALRQRPEYLLVGEVRGKEALTLFQAMSTGHTTFSTMHADSVESAIHRLENPPISVPRTMITALDIISIQSQTYLKNKRVRRNMKLVEIQDIDPNTRNIRTNDVYVWNSATDRFDHVGESAVLAEISQRRAWSKKELVTELYRRQRVLEYMVKNNIRDFHQVAAIIQAYAVKPERVLEKLQIRD
ncbi:type II/IV secretion system ATPase subunit [Methanocella sp. MCL-LM]|uniref:type II/IV secretion system ATPase subunit n=1 Tax=Methanocella sp. MCL-LM TaxID=3412035 RepID=UPI003C74926C